MADGYVRVASVAELPEGSKRVFEVGGQAVLVCQSAGRWFAVSNFCSHAREKLECGRMRGASIVCPVHGARFDLASGKATGPPAKDPIATYPIRIVEDWIEVLV
jgi:3-phenylpropionate/trans-cinnamate dioxygenase ferredoxin subunit